MRKSDHEALVSFIAFATSVLYLVKAVLDLIF